MSNNKYDTEIPVSEQFHSIQGEGEYAGHPSVFLRLQGCNLLCGGFQNRSVEKQEDMEPSEDADWVCDTISVWREASETPLVNELVDEWDARGWLDGFREGHHLILTGGEPTLPERQHQLVDLLHELEARDARPFVEVETNGTMEIIDQFDVLVDHYNVSMKLSNSGMAHDKRINGDAISHYIERWEADESVDGNEQSAMFKFVVGDADKDVPEIKELAEEYDIPDGMISVMPAGASKEQLEETYPIVAEVTKSEGWNFSPRLHVNVWDMATGV